VNLIDNAVKYSPNGGRIELRLERSNGYVQIAVKDEGLGIPPAEQDHIFEKFYRLDPDMARGVGGTGLGLYICRELAERMGGRVRVTSLPGAGSTFFFELPVFAQTT
jgi:signal transduction histidine kinase